MDFRRFYEKILVTVEPENVGRSFSWKLVQDKTNFVVMVDDLSTGFI